MGFRELVKKVQLKSGFSDKESQEALECMVENIAIRLTEGERKDFASQLPEKLKDMALAVRPSEDNLDKSLIEGFMETQDIDEPHAKKQIFASWAALKEAITEGQIEHIKTQLPKSTANMLSRA